MARDAGPVAWRDAPGGEGVEVLGDLMIGAEPTHEVVRDPATGRVYSRPDHGLSEELYPLAPSVDALRRMADAVSDFEELRGPFAGLRGRCGAEAVSEAGRLLRDAFREEDWDAIDWDLAEEDEAVADAWPLGLPTVWRILSCVKPLALIAAPGRDLRVDLAPEALTSVFGTDGVRRFAPGELPGALTHEPTRRFLTEVGLPGVDYLFGTYPGPLLTVPAMRSQDEQDPELRHLYEHGERAPLPADADRFVVLGGTAYDLHVLLDDRTGEVHYADYDFGALTPINADVSTLAFAVWLYGAVEALEKPFALKGGATGDFYYHLAETMVTLLAAVDPLACRKPTDSVEYGYWTELWHDQAGGVL